MKKIKLTTILILILIMSISCSELLSGDGKFEVISVREYHTYSQYQLAQTIGNGSTWIIDSVGKYHVGDTLILISKK